MRTPLHRLGFFARLALMPLVATACGAPQTEAVPRVAVRDSSFATIDDGVENRDPDETAGLRLRFEQDDLVARPELDPTRNDGAYLVVLKAAPFVMSLPRAVRRDRPLQLNAFLDDSNFPTIDVGAELQSAVAHPFMPGTGLAPGEDGYYRRIFLEKMGHHYVTSERFDASTGDRDGIRFEGFWDQESGDSSFDSYEERIYLLVLVDIDQDQVVDPGELERVIVVLE